jgi:hypothetical protein
MTMTDNQRAIGHLKTALSHLQAALAEVGKAGETEDTAELAAALGGVEKARKQTERAIASVTRPAAVNCPGCGGNGVALGVNPKVLKCEGCGGYFTREPITRAEACALVNLADARASRGAEERYFDFVIIDFPGAKYRTHGWFDVAGRFVVQFG